MTQTSILWVDDCAKKFFVALFERLTKLGLSINTMSTYEDAMKVISSAIGTLPKGLILDLSLPRSNKMPVEAIDVGVALAERACAKGIQRIAFYSVIPQSMVQEWLQNMHHDYPQCSFVYIEKDTPSRQVANMLVDFFK